MGTDKTDKLEITEDMGYEEQSWINIHNRKVEFLENMGCFSPYTPNMELGESYDREYKTLEKKVWVMLELPVELVKKSIEVSKVVDEKMVEYTGSEWGETPFEVLCEEYEKTDLYHDTDECIREKFESYKRSEFVSIK